MISATKPRANKAMAKKTTKAAQSDVAGEKANSMLDGHPSLKTTVAQIEKQFGEGAIMPLGVDRRVPLLACPAVWNRVVSSVGSCHDHTENESSITTRPAISTS